MTDQIVGLYHEVVGEFRHGTTAHPTAELLAAGAYFHLLIPRLKDRTTAELLAAGDYLESLIPRTAPADMPNRSWMHKAWQRTRKNLAAVRTTARSLFLTA